MGAVILKKDEMALALAEKVEAADLPASLQFTLGWGLKAVRYFNEPKKYCQALKEFKKKGRSEERQEDLPGGCRRLGLGGGEHRRAGLPGGGRLSRKSRSTTTTVVVHRH